MADYKPPKGQVFPSPAYKGQKWTNEFTNARYVYNDVKHSWIFDPEQASGGRVTISQYPPEGAFANDLWIDQKDYSLYAYDGDERAWIGITNHGITASVFTGVNPPVYQQEGALWWDSATGDLKVSYKDGNSQQWVSITGNGLNQSVATSFKDVESLVAAISDRMSGMEGGEYFSLE